MPRRRIIRKPLHLREQSGRTPDQRLALRSPGLARVVAELGARLPHGSRARQAFVWPYSRLGLEALNRRDLDVPLLASYHPSFELYPAREAVEGGLTKPVYHGTAGYREWFEDWMDAWGSDLRIDPVELIDLGDRLVLLAVMHSRGRASGVRLTEHFASFVTLERGRIVRDDTYSDHGEALAAAGL